MNHHLDSAAHAAATKAAVELRATLEAVELALSHGESPSDETRVRLSRQAGRLAAALLNLEHPSLASRKP